MDPMLSPLIILAHSKIDFDSITLSIFPLEDLRSFLLTGLRNGQPQLSGQSHTAVTDSSNACYSVGAAHLAGTHHFPGSKFTCWGFSGGLDGKGSWKEEGGFQH